MFPVLHGPAKLAGKVRHGLSCVDERWKWFWASYSQTGESVSLFAPSCQAQHHVASNTSETWDTTLHLAGNKRAFASGALQRELPCLFWDTREASPCLHMRDIPEQSCPVPLRRGNVLTMLIKHPTGVSSSWPQSWVPAAYFCNTPAWAARQTKELGNSWQRNPGH